MAFGVSDVFSLATFIHACEPAHIRPLNLDNQCTVVLVDSGVKSGNTLVEFVQHVRLLRPTIRIVVVAGVVQADSMTQKSVIDELGYHSALTIVALRLSDNKFTGKSVTDTGNRLFNTTQLS